MKKSIIFIGFILFFFLITYDVNASESKLELDYPYTNYGASNVLNFQGWIMTTDQTAKVKVLVDGEYIDDELIKREEREDVLKAITGYGGRNLNSKPGYYGQIDISKYQKGTSHKFRVEVRNLQNELIDYKETTFVIKDYEGRIEIDYPSINKIVKTSMDIQGWVMTTDPKAEVEVYIDDKKYEEERYAREDVLKAIIGYGGRITNKTPGYKIEKLDTTSLKDGTHTLKILLKDSSGKEITSATRKFTVRKYDAKIEIDSPINSNINKQDISFKGWIMSESKDATVKVLIDGEEINSNMIKREEREDVLKAITGYGGRSANKTPGYSGTIDYKKYAEGNHTFTVKVCLTKTDECIADKSTSFFLKKYSTMIEIDSPLVDSIQKTSINIKGWVMSDDKNGILEVYFDNKKIDTSLYSLKRTEREDVLKAITGYGDRSTNPTPGYELVFDTSSINDGRHSVTVKYISSENNSIFTSKNNVFNIRKYNGILYVDDPVGSNFSSDINVRGWELSELDNSYVKAYIDNSEVKTLDRTREDGSDVFNFYPNSYGGKEKNSNPRFNDDIPINNYSEGTHTLTLKLFTKLNEEIASYSKQIFISKGRYYGVDVSRHNGSINWSTMKSMGIDYAMIRAGYRGYGAEGSLNKDNKFEENISNATSHGIRCGVYFFSQAISYEEGKAEAQYLFDQILPGYIDKISMPIVIDTEWSHDVHDGRADYLSKYDRTMAVKGFVDEVSRRGYSPMIYASTSWLYDNIDMSYFQNVGIWVAQWSSSVSYNGPYQIWQYTDAGNGYAYGAGSSALDLDYIYMRY